MANAILSSENNLSFACLLIEQHRVNCGIRLNNTGCSFDLLIEQHRVNCGIRFNNTDCFFDTTRNNEWMDRKEDSGWRIELKGILRFIERKTSQFL
ncbi:unnamed protein product [Caenorhabditis angaria]|uniref:Uncharacterized protein n=1 Tax=Caenorhabditis angaria TaxID=860376 RepID=A0A9P1N0J4_9PELO|nr:unnamed protein product [Caenorhabditis angaria]